ncbi:MAG TPA: imidazole glycerol phosphate synthase subunit HisH [Thermoanaerobaculia bacterium]|nr:imidazole glycerol phosphate synthase subunit HisH [Thermoanaerobaculia bacterium]
MTRVLLIDSPVANSASIARALRAAGADLQISSDPDDVRRASRLVLPGVGTFGAAMSWLRRTGNDDAIRDAVARGAALLGICVGHQLLFDGSEEWGAGEDTGAPYGGLGLIRGIVRKLACSLPVPQIGWNRVKWTGASTRLFDGIADSTPFYFVHSYAATSCDAEVASAAYGVSFTAAVQQANVFGVQFHPEKSSAAGLRILRNYVMMQ